MYRMYGMPRVQGCTGAAHVQDVLYSVPQQENNLESPAF